jgi:hypothetical protein
MNIFDDYTLQFELYGLAQDYSVLEILYLVSEPLLLAKTWKCIYWQKGKSRKFTVKNMKQLIRKLSQLQYNEIEIKSSQVVFLPNTNQSILFNFDGYLNISPTNEMWDSVWDDYFENHAHEQRRMSYQSKEGSARYHNIQKYPFFYEFSIPCIKLDDPDEIFVKLIPIIVETIKRSPISTPYFGGLEFRRSRITNPFINSLDFLAPWPGTYPLIGEYADKLRPLTIASESLCRKIAQTLSLPKKSIVPLVPCKTTAMAIIHIPYDIINDDGLKDVISPILVPKDDSTVFRRGGNDEGEFTLDGSLICTLRRFKELTEKKIMPILRGHCEYTLCLGIPEKYCIMLGIDLEDMIVLQVQRERKKINEERFDQLFEQTPKSWSDKERVRKVIEMLPISGSEYAEFIVQHYLS